MKKFLLFLGLMFINITMISAKELIASCVYEPQEKINEYAVSTLKINIYDDYSFGFDNLSEYWNNLECDTDDGNFVLSYSGNYSNGVYSTGYSCPNIGATASAIAKYDFLYGNFIKDSNFSCENIQTLYYSNELNFSAVTLIHDFYLEKKDNSKTIYKLNKNKSKVYIQNPTKNEDAEGWLKVCHYGNYILKFNKQKYEFNQMSLKYEYPHQKGDIMGYLAKNNYSCPMKFCYYNASGTQDINGEAFYGTLGYFINLESDHILGKTCFYSADYSGSEFTCGGISSYMEDFDENNKKYNETKELNYLDLRKKSEENLNKFCSSVLTNLDYNDPSKCTIECINIKQIIQDRLNKEDSDGNTTCPLSNRLISWIANIVKWLKYIAPVIVIIFGILDFIKAMSADKDDEMKKAQGKFIKRLIAAALIFLIPLIIGFVLEQLGFEVTGCGIIKELD